MIINFLLTEREGRTGENWPEVVAVRTERSEVRTKTTEGQYSPVRLELARLVSSLLYGFLITFCFVFCKPVIGPWALREINALQFQSQLANQSARYIGYKHKPYNNT